MAVDNTLLRNAPIRRETKTIIGSGVGVGYTRNIAVRWSTNGIARLLTTKNNGGRSRGGIDPFLPLVRHP